MTTPAQLAANQRNARKSTGPTSAEGKVVAAQNAMKHGLHAQDVVCAEEQSGEYSAFAESLYADLAPADSVEAALVDRIATLSWRLQRMVCIEASLVDSFGAASDRPLMLNENTYVRSFVRATSEMQALSRYEASLDRALSRAFALLERRQARRRGSFRRRSAWWSRDLIQESLIRLSHSPIRQNLKTAKRTQFSMPRPKRRAS